MLSHEKHGDSENLIVACSGGTDVGEIADRAARKLGHGELGNMTCLAGIAGRVPEIMEKAANAHKILVIDGCPRNCAANCLNEVGFHNFKHLSLNDLDFIKGHCPVTDENISSAAAIGAVMLFE